ncbi:MAG: subclass B3 metallo-beta-lactamase [Alteraurantiacibacter sp.]
MFGKAPAIAALLLCACASTPPSPVSPALQMDGRSWAERCEDWDDWDKPAPPFQIFGNSYYVGTCGIAAVLITGNDGHVLIDTGTEQGAVLVAENIATLGFDVRDIKVILQSHEHHDHIGGAAMLQSLTGARLIASAPAAEVLRTGRASSDDPQFGQLPAVEPVDESATVQIIEYDDYELSGSDSTLRAVATPGHTSGAMSWTWNSCDGFVCVRLVFADSLSAISSDGYRFSDHPENVQAFRDSIARLSALDCDILLTPHPSASGMRDKLIAEDVTLGMDCAAYAADRLRRLEARLAIEASDASQ